MHLKYLVVILTFSFYISACATHPTPQNATEYRAAVAKGVPGATLKSYNLNHSYSNAVKLLEKQTDKCLHVKYKVTTCPQYGLVKTCSEAIITYLPVMTRDRQQTTLQVHRGMDPDNGVYLGGPPPKEGMIISVIDITPAGGNKSRLDIYSPDHFFEDVPNAVKSWLTSSNRGCPNLVGD